MAAPEKPTRPYSSVFPRQFACTHSDELCEVTRSSNAEGRLLYSPRRLFDYGFRLRLQLIGRQLNLSKINYLMHGQTDTDRSAVLSYPVGGAALCGISPYSSVHYRPCRQIILMTARLAMSLLRFDGRVALITGAGGGKPLLRLLSCHGKLCSNKCAYFSLFRRSWAGVCTPTGFKGRQSGR